MTLIKTAYAVIQNPILDDPSTPVNNPKLYFNNVISSVLSVFFIVAVLYFAWFFIMAGYHLIDSRGDPKHLEQAREQLTNSLIGLVIVLSVFAIIKFVGHFLGVGSLQNLIIDWPTI